MGGQPPLQKVLNAWLFDVIYLSFGQTLELDGMEANPIPRIGDWTMDRQTQTWRFLGRNRQRLAGLTRDLDALIDRRSN